MITGIIGRLVDVTRNKLEGIGPVESQHFGIGNRVVVVENFHLPEIDENSVSNWKKVKNFSRRI